MPEFYKTLEQLWLFDLSRIDEVSLTAIFLILFFTTFLTEDGACLAAGALAGQGHISFLFAVSACFAGIFVGDVGLYLIGRASGRSLSRNAIFKRFVSDETLLNASEWLEKRGVAAIFISRFVAGLRLPTYLAAGFLKTSFLKFVFYFIIAAAIWTPLLVGSAAFAQSFISPRYFFVSIIGLYLLLHLAINLVTWRRRRLFLGKLKRIGNWEFWPLPIFYTPVFLYVLLLAVRHRSLTVFTCANPAIVGGGFIGESKDKIYRGLSASAENTEFLLEHVLMETENEEAFETFEAWRKTKGLDFPFAVKPDSGERGADVSIVRSNSEFKEYSERTSENFIVQEFAGGPEISVFYFRFPSEDNGKIYSITEKEFPMLKGDGISTVEELILKDSRTVCLASQYFEQNHDRLGDIPEVGEEVPIIEIGTHSRGTVFKEGDRFKTPSLESAIDRISKGYEGFYFGRFDLRAPTIDDFKDGRGFKVIELNGVTSESTNIYDERYSLFDAYRILFKQWRIAFEIGAANAAAGAEATGLKVLFDLYLGIEHEEDPQN
ncbi:MAG: hypothetical protein HKN33_16330 [Pyrinomonadaceae bacterium]|nr:hypothetical protein [Pyrinomonadaceae bacterium]